MNNVSRIFDFLRPVQPRAPLRLIRCLTMRNSTYCKEQCLRSQRYAAQLHSCSQDMIRLNPNPCTGQHVTASQTSSCFTSSTLTPGVSGGEGGLANNHRIILVNNNCKKNGFWCEECAAAVYETHFSTRLVPEGHLLRNKVNRHVCQISHTENTWMLLLL